MEGLGVVVLAGNTKIKSEIRRVKRKGLFHRLRNPRLWLATRTMIEASIASTINMDDYIVGENKTLLYLHPDLISQKNINFLKRVLYFAGKTGDRIYRKNKQNLLEFLSREGISSISLVLRAIIEAPSVDSEMMVIVGPRGPISKELASREIEGIHLVPQGMSIGENILLGKERLLELGYSKKYFLVVGGDIPLITPGSVEGLLKEMESRGGSPDMYYGMGSRAEVGEFIKAHGLEHMGRVGPNYPKKGNLNKFGFPIVDDVPLFDRKGERVQMMVGNIFIYRTASVDRSFIDKFYSLRKMAANPITYPFLIRNFGPLLFRALRWRVGLKEAESVFKETTGIHVRVVPVHPEAALDLDSYSDLRRLSALHFHRQGGTRDLERDFKEYVRQKKRQQRRAKSGKSTGRRKGSRGKGGKNR
ncbi:MAG: hypothetical protein ACMUIE_07810 [Thermoplasmatota archaeon]